MIVFHGITDLDLAQTLDCGQCFRWGKNPDGSFSGVAFGQRVTVSMDGSDLTVDGADEGDR